MELPTLCSQRGSQAKTHEMYCHKKKCTTLIFLGFCLSLHYRLLQGIAARWCKSGTDIAAADGDRESRMDGTSGTKRLTGSRAAGLGDAVYTDTQQRGLQLEVRGSASARRQSKIDPFRQFWQSPMRAFSKKQGMQTPIGDHRRERNRNSTSLRSPAPAPSVRISGRALAKTWTGHCRRFNVSTWGAYAHGCADGWVPRELTPRPDRPGAA